MEKKPRELLGIALRIHLKRRGHGSLSIVASDAGMEQPKLSKIKSGSIIGSVDDWHAIASALDTTYHEMLELGKTAISDFLNGGQEVKEVGGVWRPKDPAEEKHIQIIPGFKNKPLALSINRKLQEIEKHDPDKLEYINDLFAEWLREYEYHKKKAKKPPLKKASGES